MAICWGMSRSLYSALLLFCWYGEYFSGMLTERGPHNRRGLQQEKRQAVFSEQLQLHFEKRKYIGEYQYQDVVISGGVPAILSNDLLYQVQARLEKNKRTPAMVKADINQLLITTLFC